jgi:ABC-2 type transport system permease protein
MFSALFFLQTRSFWNGLILRLRRLRQPKYLVGGLVGLAWILWTFGGPFFLQSMTRQSGRGRGGPGTAAELFGLGADGLVLMEGIAACGVAAWVFLSWVLPNSRAALQFTEPEIAFLFPAPIGRRRLIHYKIIRWQIGLLMTSMIFTFISGRFARDGGWMIHLVGWWLILFALNLHGLAASFTLTRLLDLGLTSWRRRGILLAVLMISGVAMILWAQRYWPEFEEGQTLLEKGRALLTSPVGYWALWPFRLLVRPSLAGSFQEFLRALGPALGLLALQYLWVMRAEVSFEEASIALSQKRADLMASAREGNWQAGAASRKPRRAPFVLAASGFPPVALLWKNLIAAGAVMSGRTGFFLLIWIGVMGVSFASGSNQGLSGVLLAVGSMALVLLTLMGAQVFRNDLRQDLVAADLLKQFPMPGWQIALGELLAPALLLTALQWALVLFLLCLSVFGDLGAVPPMEARLALSLCILMLAPTYNMVTLLVPNLATLLFPAWFHAGRDGAAGLEVLGQRLLFTVGTLLAVLISLVPAGLVFGVVWFLVQLVMPPWVGAPAGAMAASIVLLVEISIGIYLLGRVFDRMDLTSA